MIPAVELRACRAGDLSAVSALLSQLSTAAHGPSDFAVDRLADLLAQMEAAPEVYENLVATVSGRVVGFISVIFYKTLFHRGGTALINELVVDEHLRGTGIGQALVARAVADARGRGMDEVEVGTEQENHRAQAFYRKCGFDEEYVLMGMEFA